MPSRKIGLSIVCLAAAAAVGYALAARRQQNLNTPVVHTYMVAPERAEEVKTSLQHLLSMPDGQGGTAQVFGNGLVLVRAPIGFQNGIGFMVQQLAKEETPARRRVRLDCYVIMGQASKASNAADLGELGTALSAIERVDGPNHFRILEHLAQNSITGEESAGDGYLMKVKSVVVALKNSLLLKVNFDTLFGKVRTNTEIQPGEYVVLGQNAQLVPDQGGGDTRLKRFGEGNIYYIVRGEVLK